MLLFGEQTGYHFKNEQLYYFDQRQPNESIPSSLRSEDVVAVKDYTDPRVQVTEPFNKPINRVAMAGGLAEQYNYNAQQWEENGQGFFEGIHARNTHHNSSFR